MSKPTSQEAKNAVNIFASIDVLGLLSDTDYPNTNGSIEDEIKDFFLNDSNVKKSAYAPLLAGAKAVPLQEWSEDDNKYVIDPIWAGIIKSAKGNAKRFSNTSGTQAILSKYVRLIANRGDTQGWKLSVNESDLVEHGGRKYLTEAYNLSVKAKPGQWLRWWGNSVTPFSSIQCVIGKITEQGRPHDLPELDHQQDATVVYQYPSAIVGTTKYMTADHYAFSRMGELKNSVAAGRKIQYDILFNMVDTTGKVIASFQVDPEIIVIND